jgi:hypothetical protein
LAGQQGAFTYGQQAPDRWDQGFGGQTTQGELASSDRAFRMIA